jgi:peptidylprolyl isomerase
VGLVGCDPDIESTAGFTLDPSICTRLKVQHCFHCCLQGSSTYCVRYVKEAPLITTPSGLQYKDVIVGDGAEPIIGFQVVVDYIAKNEKGLIFDNSLEKGKPNDVRVTGDPTSCLVIPGLDEGILTMRSGGLRRMYIPGELAFPKGLASAPGRPRISPFSPVVFDVALRYIPGLE